MVRVSQETVKRVGHQLRMEVNRNEWHQTQYQPLQAYMDQELIVKHMRPWQQIVMFIARTQAPHEWRSPGYQFTARQWKTWQVLWEVAGRPVEDVGGEDNDTEEDELRLDPIHKACLDFCIELLNQACHVHDYESVMVCGLAVLGVRKDGWRDEDDYPPILSRLIKVARFMVVLKAMQLDPNAQAMCRPMHEWRKEWNPTETALPGTSPMNKANYIYSGDSGYGSESTPCPLSQTSASSSIPCSSSIPPSSPPLPQSMHRPTPERRPIFYVFHYCQIVAPMVEERSAHLCDEEQHHVSNPFSVNAQPDLQAYSSSHANLTVSQPWN